MTVKTSMFKTPEGEARYFAAYDETMKRWPVEVQSLDILTSFGSTHVNMCGSEDAPALFLIPGQAVSSTMWYPNIQALSQHHRVYTLDILGDMGKSVQTRPYAQPTDFAKWLNEVFDALHIKQAHVAGISYGGFIATQFALVSPERINKLILMSPAAFLSIAPSYFLRMMIVFLPFLSFETRQKLITGTDSKNITPAIQQLMTPNDFQYKMYLPKNFKDSQLRQLRVPTLLMMGEDEVVYNPKRTFARAEKLIPNIETTLVPGGGHAVNIDQPELVNRQILTFIQKRSAR